MPQSLSKIYLHIVYSTKYREPFLTDPEIRSQLHSYMAGICEHQQSPPIIIGGVADHVHILCLLSRTCCVADLVKEIKRSSSLWLKEEWPDLFQNFAWQGGYGVFSVNPRGVNRVKRYIENQVAHHRRTSFQDEYRKYLYQYKVEYDERYVWD